MTPYNKKGNYDDIIDLPHHVSKTRPRMSNLDRAAQFSPFAALVGYDAAVKETARRTDERVELEENQKTILNEKLQLVLDQVEPAPEIQITYFLPDKKKFGGSYVTVSGQIKKVDTYEQEIVLKNGIKVPLTDVIEIDGEIFGSSYFG